MSTLWSMMISPDLARSQRKGSSLLRLWGHTTSVGSNDNDSSENIKNLSFLIGSLWSQDSHDRIERSHSIE